MNHNRPAFKSIVIGSTVLGLVVCGCRNDEDRSERAPAARPQNGEARAARPTPAPAEDPDRPRGDRFDEPTAREKLGIALDSWVFGDEPERFKEEHPEISFVNTSYLFERPRLQKYDIGAGRSERNIPAGVVGYQFPVVLALESRAGSEIKKKHNFSVRTSDNLNWSVYISK